MDASGVYESLKGKFPDHVLTLVTDNPDPFIVINKTAITEICRYLKTQDGLEFDFLRSISGVDTEEELELVYHLFSYKHRAALTLKMIMAYDDVEVPSVESVWKAGDWHEREQFDLFGFYFTGHPDLRRVLLPEDWVGHPLLKTYEYPEDYHGIDHHRPDPLDQFKALDDLKSKARETKAKEVETEGQGTEATKSVEADPQDASPQNAATPA